MRSMQSKSKATHDLTLFVFMLIVCGGVVKSLVSTLVGSGSKWAKPPDHGHFVPARYFKTCFAGGLLGHVSEHFMLSGSL